MLQPPPRFDDAPTLTHLLGALRRRMGREPARGCVGEIGFFIEDLCEAMGAVCGATKLVPTVEWHVHLNRLRAGLDLSAAHFKHLDPADFKYLDSAIKQRNNPVHSNPDMHYLDYRDVEINWNSLILCVDRLRYALIQVERLDSFEEALWRKQAHDESMVYARNVLDAFGAEGTDETLGEHVAALARAEGVSLPWARIPGRERLAVALKALARRVQGAHGDGVTALASRLLDHVDAETARRVRACIEHRRRARANEYEDLTRLVVCVDIRHHPGDPDLVEVHRCGLDHPSLSDVPSNLCDEPAVFSRDLAGDPEFADWLREQIDATVEAVRVAEGVSDWSVSRRVVVRFDVPPSLALVPFEDLLDGGWHLERDLGVFTVHPSSRSFRGYPGHPIGHPSKDPGVVVLAERCSSLDLRGRIHEKKAFFAVREAWQCDGDASPAAEGFSRCALGVLGDTDHPDELLGGLFRGDGVIDDATLFARVRELRTSQGPGRMRVKIFWADANYRSLKLRGTERVRQRVG